jgi:hypothetical protein
MFRFLSKEIFSPRPLAVSGSTAPGKRKFLDFSCCLALAGRTRNARLSRGTRIAPEQTIFDA